MKFALPLFLASVALDSVTALGEKKKDTLQGRRQLKKLDDTCIASIVDVEYEDRITDDEFMTCETPSGKSYKVKAVDKAFIKKNFGSGKLLSGEVELEFDGDAMMDESTAEIISKYPPRLSINGTGSNGRQLQTQVGNCGTYLGGSCAGTRSVLVVRVIAADKTTTDSESELSDSVFGTSGDSLNLKSWYNQCSYNQLNFIPAEGTDINGGVTTVTVPSSTTDGDSVMNNDIVTALNAKFGVSNPNQIANHIMYCLPPGTMNGIAYANINNWRSVYSDKWCTYVSAQAHEVGHNLLLAHSGDPAATGSSATYGDKSGMMGFSDSVDDGPRQCFNAPKNWQLGWYDDKQISVPFDGWEGNLIGLSDYGNSHAAAEDMVIAKVDLNESYYVSFNRKTGINSGTVEGGNQVLVHKRDLGTNYGDSDVLAYLNSGGLYSSPDSKFRVTVNDIDLTSNPARANVKIERFDDTPPCYTGTASVSITPDNYPGETSWEIRDDAEIVLLSGGSTGTSNIVLADGYYTFTMYDSYGDGICCGVYGDGSYTFQVGSTVVKTGGEFGSSDRTQFGICNNTSPPTKAPTSSPTAAPTKSPTPNPTVSPTNPPSPAPTKRTTASPTAAPTKSPTPNPTVPPTVAPTKSPTANPTVASTNAPTNAVTSSPTSSQGCDSTTVRVEIVTDKYAEETSWQLTDVNSAVVLSGGGYADSDTTFTSEVCVDDWTSLSFTINDSYGDGICCAYGSGSYTVTVNDNAVLSGGAFGSIETKPLFSLPCDYGNEVVNGEIVCKCAPNEMRIAVALRTDRYPEETTWTITTCGGVELSSGSYTDKEFRHFDSICVPNSVPYRFQINDLYGDGICCTYGFGNYQISIDGTEVVSAAGNFGSSEVQDLNGVCSTNIVVSDPPLKCSSVTRKQDCLGNCEWVGKRKNNGKCTLKPKEEPTPKSMKVKSMKVKSMKVKEETTPKAMKLKEEPTPKCAACPSTGTSCCGTCVNNGPEWMRGCYSASKVSLLT